MSNLTGEFLISLGFKEDGYTNSSYDYYLDKKDYSIFINLRSTPDKSRCIIIYNNDYYKSYPRPIDFTVEDLKTAIKPGINFKVNALE